MSHTSINGLLTPCQVSEKSNVPILRKLMERRKDRPMEVGIDRPYFIGPFWLLLGVHSLVRITFYVCISKEKLLMNAFSKLNLPTVHSYE